MRKPSKFSRFFAFFFAFLLLVSCYTVSVSASSGAIHAIDITADLDKQGNAQISEVWDVTVPDSWTELYTVKANLDDMEIRNFVVEDLDTGKTFRSEGKDWNVNDSRSEKAGRSGIYINDDGDPELCWGVGTSGRHQYKISYEMTNMVKQYTDGYAGFNIRFVNEGLSSEPEQARVIIRGPENFTQNNTAMWAFGMEGETYLKEGAIIAKSAGKVNYCNVMVRFDQGMFKPVSRSNQSFEQVRKTAMKHSSYSSSEDSGLSGWDIFGVGAIIALFGALFTWLSHRKRTDSTLVTDKIDRSALRDPPYSRELPFDGNLAESYLVLQAVQSHVPESRIMSAYLLRWFQKGQIKAAKQSGSRWSLFGEKQQTVLSFGDPERDMSRSEQKLWTILTQAAGEDQTLQEKELYVWSKSHYEQIKEFYTAVEQEGQDDGTANGDIGLVQKRVLLTHQQIPGLTDQGAKRAVAMMGFKKYLKDFTIINERQVRDVGLWKDYLVYASLFGIADEVAKEFRDVLPEYFEQTPEAGLDPGWDAFDFFIFLNMMDHISTASYSGYVDGMPSASSSAGFGGFTSLGGGGGFSGGGFGGGGR